MGSSSGPRSRKTRSGSIGSARPSALRGIRMVPAVNSELVTRIVGEPSKARAMRVIIPISPLSRESASPKGASARLIIGKLRQRANKKPIDGRSFSWKISSDTLIDYAVGVSVEILIVAEPGFEPNYAQPGDAGADLRSIEDTLVPARGRVLVGTGVKIAMPDGFVGLIHPRSGLAAKHGITVLNTPGTVDAGYRGEIKVTLYNTTDNDFPIQRGDRIAQLVFQKVERANFIAVTELPETARGEAGFGSTGRS